MNNVYYGVLGVSSLFFIYAFINVLLTFKFVKSLSTIMKSKYISLTKTSIVVLVFSLLFILGSLAISEYLFKSLLLIISMFLNVYNLSEIFVLKKYL